MGIYRLIFYERILFFRKCEIFERVIRISVEYLTLTRIAGAETIDLTTGVTPSGGDPLVFSGEKTGIASGYYWLNVRIRDGAGRYAGKSEATHIYQNLTAQAVYAFTAEDFSLHTVTYSVGAGGGKANPIPLPVNLVLG
jgi:hypothetical protein